MAQFTSHVVFNTGTALLTDMTQTEVCMLDTFEQP